MMTSQASSKFLRCLSTHVWKLQTSKYVFPSCYCFPSILQVSLQQKGFVNHDLGWKVCYFKTFSSALWLLGWACNRPWERGRLRKERLHWYACDSICLLARNKKKTTKAIICRSPLPGTLSKAAHPTAFIILWLDWIPLGGWNVRAPWWVPLLYLGLPFSCPFFQHLLAASSFNVIFPFVLLPLLVHPGSSSRGEKNISSNPCFRA